MIHRAALSFVLLTLLSVSLVLPLSAARADQAPAATASGMELGAPFANGAILQRDMAVPIWGWAKPGATVTAQFAGQKKTATADSSGKWMVHLDPMSASFKPRTMTINSSAGGAATIKDILVGEVWLASGQSNMELRAGRTSANQISIKPVNGQAPVREFVVTSCYAQLQPIEKATGQWNNGNYGEYSAIALSFADMLYQELHVPIGILNCSFSMTQIQAWTPRVGFRDGRDAYTQDIYKQVLESDPRTPAHKAAWDAYYQQIANTLKQNAQLVQEGKPAKAIPTQPPGNLHGNRDATWLFNARLNPVIPYAIRGGIWNQGYANMHGGYNYYHDLHNLIRGWRIRWNRPKLPVYFHQFYTPGDGSAQPTIGNAADMRLATWQARDIPDADMASQIDIGGAVHYRHKTVPGMRLALLALKNQYPTLKLQPTTDYPTWQMPADGKAADLVAHGPMFKSYTVDGDKLIVSFKYADDGLVVGKTSNTHGRHGAGYANPQVIPHGDDQVKLFYIADANGVWHQATMKIQGDKVVLTAPGVPSPHGVSYANSGVGFTPSLYNKAMLPTTPFIYFDHKLVNAENWPGGHLKIAGLVRKANAVGLEHVWRKMPILSTQFRDNAVLQAGQPITFWGSALHDWGYAAKGDAVIKFSFNGIKKTIHVNQPGPNVTDLGPHTTMHGSGREWHVTVPAMKPSTTPKTLKVSFYINGKLAHEQIAHNIVIGDVWYVAAPDMNLDVPTVANPDGMVRVIQRKAKRSSAASPSRYSVAISHTPTSRFRAEWKPATTGFAGWLGEQIHAKTGEPVGIIFMQNTVHKHGSNPQLKSWIAPLCLKDAPSLQSDYANLAGVIPGTKYYDANVHRYVAAWKQYWHSYIPQMIATKAVPPDTQWGAVWGSYPHLGGSVTSNASQTYNVLVDSFTPAAVKGVIFLTSPAMFQNDHGAHFGGQMSALANCWKRRFDPKQDPWFFYTIPSQQLAQKVTRPQGIHGKHAGLEIQKWPGKQKSEGKPTAAALIKNIVAKAYP